MYSLLLKVWPHESKTLKKFIIIVSARRVPFKLAQYFYKISFCYLKNAYLSSKRKNGLF